MVQAGTLFGYLSAFITIVVAIAVGDLAVSFHRLLRARRVVKWRPLPLLAALFVLLTLLTQFFEIWQLADDVRITYHGLIWLVASPLVYFLSASAVLPDEVPPEGLDLEAFYFHERRYIYGLLGFALALETVDGVTANNAWLLEHPTILWTVVAPLAGAALAACTAMWISHRPWVHWLGLAVLFACGVAAYSSWEVQGASAVTPAAPAASAAPGQDAR